MSKKISTKALAWLAGIGLGVMGAGVGVYWILTGQDVWLINGLPGAVEVRIDDGAGLTLAEGEKLLRPLRSGAHRVLVKTADGKLLSQEQVVVPARHDLVVYNVLGAAPLYVGTVVYRPREFGEESPPPPEFYLGRRLVAQRRMDYLFERPPEHLTLSSQELSETRWYAELVPGGWPEAVRRARSLQGDNGSGTDALALCQAAATLQPADEAALDCVVNQSAMMHGHEAARKASLRALEQRPRSYALHLGYQGVMRFLDRSAELRKEYAALHEKNPDDPLFTVLYARTLAPAEAVPLYTKALRGDGEIIARRGLALALEALGRLPESLALLETMAQSDPEYPRYLDTHARLLLRLGRAADAFAIAATVAKDKKRGGWEAAVLVAEIVQAGKLKDLDGIGYVNALIEKDDDAAVFLLSLFGQQPTTHRRATDAIARVAAIHIAAARDPEQAWRSCQESPPGSLRTLSPEVALLLAAEFERVGDPASAAPLYHQALQMGVPISAVRAYVQDGTEHPELWHLDVDARTALDLVRARVLETEGRDASALRTALSKRAVLSTIVASAVEHWPAANREVVRLRPDPI